jgi:putative transposase
MVDHPAKYPWSSYRTNGQGEPSNQLTPHPLYTAMGKNNGARQAAYRGLFQYELDPETIDEIRAATNGNYALGSASFQAQVAAMLGRRVAPGKSGRPRKREELGSTDLFDES